MASSFISNWETLGHVDPNVAFFDDNVLGFDITSDLVSFFSDPFEDSLLPLDPGGLFAPDINGSGQISYETDLLFAADPQLNRGGSVPSTPPHIHPGGDDAGDAAQLDHFQQPKRRRICRDNSADVAASAYHSPPASCRRCELFPAAEDHFIPLPPTPPPQEEEADVSSRNVVRTDWKAAASPQGLSPQSAAARERRRRIREKTHELGKLIPGGSRMNTAEMFQAAHKYVKFLQAQIGVLSPMGSIQQLPQEMEQQVEVLVGSEVVQDKLCREGRCVVPRVMVEAFAKDEKVRSNHLVSRDLDRFIDSIE